VKPHELPLETVIRAVQAARINAMALVAAMQELLDQARAVSQAISARVGLVSGQEATPPNTDP
jgi:hypothetical protein